ncbi:hypothetical protein KIPB_014490, partial [Kipferlia bialata]
SHPLSSFRADILTLPGLEAGTISMGTIYALIGSINPMILLSVLFSLAQILVEVTVGHKQDGQKFMLHVNGASVGEYWTGHFGVELLIYAGAVGIFTVLGVVAGDPACINVGAYILLFTGAVLGLSGSTNLLGSLFSTIQTYRKWFGLFLIVRDM